MPTHKSEDYKLSAVEYYLTEDNFVFTVSLFGLKISNLAQ